jgi:hypothetical protein
VGFFKKKSKNTVVDTVKDGELIAVLSAAVAASGSDEHIAAIAAALAAYEDGGVTSALHISKIDRTAGILPAWGVMGNREQIETRKF